MPIYKLDRPHISNLTACLKVLEQKEQVTTKRSRWKEIIKHGVKSIKQKQTKRTQKKSIELRVGSLRKSVILIYP